MAEQQQPERRDGDTRAELSGTAGHVVQARDVHGSVHFHAAPPGEPRPEGGPVPWQLPPVVSGFVNRAAERATLDRLLAEQPPGPRILVITGTAGVGKTSLALHWAHTARRHFPDGQLYANLHGHDPEAPATPAQVLHHFLRALDVPAAAIPADPEALAAAYRSLLAERRLLVVLDNAATAAQVRPLLPAAPGCLVVVTSRSRLPGLGVREGARHLTLDVFPEPEAVALLLAVMAEYRSGDDPAELAQLARLCARLPLALRIAAERAAGRPLMPLDDLIQDLRDESGLWDALSAADAEGAEESEAVRTVFAWSYRALPAEAARLFRLLGLHPSGEFSDLAAAALAGTALRPTRRLLDALVAAHLVEQTAADRYRFHDLLRAYAIDQARSCAEAPEENERALRRVLTWYLHAADALQAAVAPHEPRVALEPLEPGVEPPVFTGFATAMAWYRAEQDNLPAALHAADAAGADRIVWQLAVVLRAVYMTENPFAQWFATTRLALAAARRSGDRAAEAELLESLGMAHTQCHQPDAAAEQYRAALALRREVGDRLGEALTLNGIGLLELRRHRPQAAASAFEQGLALVRRLGDRHWEPRITVNLAQPQAELGRLAEAEAAIGHGLALFRADGAHRPAGNALHLLSIVQLAAGRPDEALQSAEAAVDLAVELGSASAEGYWLTQLGRVQLALGRPAEALAGLHRAAQLLRRVGNPSREATAWDETGLAYRVLGLDREAAEFHRRALAVHRELGDHWRCALALAHLTAVLAPEEANRCRAEALGLLAEFDDPAAVRLRAELGD
ncbi:ATP-binding protein [Kitasatospora sp. LaBMicrA B282]|uniref:ATP-binding protein n=1 Tax=Kitasatospora sp. LaBMicrA B282 TaxID=3420949 RepID=UPI003D0E0C6A